MLSINTIKSGVREKEEYYTEDESLETKLDPKQIEYYSERETQSEIRSLTQAIWHGKGAKQLGLEGNVLKKDFKDLFYGIKPGTEERIRGEKATVETQERLAEAG
jgi:TrwC relaxase